MGMGERCRRKWMNGILRRQNIRPSVGLYPDPGGSLDLATSSNRLWANATKYRNMADDVANHRASDTNKATDGESETEPEQRECDSESYEAILFDCDGVLVETPGKGNLVEAMRRVQHQFELSDPPEQMVADFFRGNLSSITDRCRSAGIDRKAFCAEAAREAVQAQLTEIRSGLRTTYDDIDAVQKLNQPLGVISDNHPRVLSFLFQRFDLTSCFEAVRGCRFTPAELECQKRLC